MDNMTAKVSCFARAYHYKNNDTWIFKDEFAERILGEEEYGAIAENMAMGIQFFSPGFEGTKEEALEFIVEHQLAPSVLGRSAFNENHLTKEISLGAGQYIVFASGYDTYAFRNKNNLIKIFELDLPKMLEDKTIREKTIGIEKAENRRLVPCNLAERDWKQLLESSGYQKDKKSFGSLLGICYYMDKESFGELIANISEVMSEGSAICFDYPSICESEETRKNEKLASGAGEEMEAKYSEKEIEDILSEHGFLVYEHIDAKEMTKQYFESYNMATGKSMCAPVGVKYVFAVKKYN